MKLEPKIVEQAKRRPGRCLASGDVEGPFIDTGKWTREHDPYVYLSVRWIEEVAHKLCKMVSQDDFEYHVKDLTEQVAKLTEEIGALRRFEDAATEYEEARQGVTETSGEVALNGAA